MDKDELIAQQAQFVKELTSIKDHEKWMYGLAAERANKYPESAWGYKKWERKGRLSAILLSLRLAENLLCQSAPQPKKPVCVRGAIKIAIDELRSIDGESDLAEVDKSIDVALTSLLSVYETTAGGEKNESGRSEDVSNA